VDVLILSPKLRRSYLHYKWNSPPGGNERGACASFCIPVMITVENKFLWLVSCIFSEIVTRLLRIQTTY
jgi:hypothetical protein